MARGEARLLRGAGRRPDAVRRRHQEGVPRGWRASCIPDVNPDPQAGERFREAAEAYEVLTRCRHPRPLRPLRARRRWPARQFHPDQFMDFSALCDLLGAFFGDDLFGGAAAGASRGAATPAVALELTLAEAAFGVTREVRVRGGRRAASAAMDAARSRARRPSRCADLRRHRAASSTSPRPRSASSSRPPPARPAAAAASCIDSPCTECRGRGRRRRPPRPSRCQVPGRHRRRPAPAPARPRPRGRARRAAGRSLRDRAVRRRPALRARRQRPRLGARPAVQPGGAGRASTVETLDGSEQVEVQPGAQPGEVMVLRGKGVPVLHGRGRGDHQVVRERARAAPPDRRSARPAAAVRAAVRRRHVRRRRRLPRPPAGRLSVRRYPLRVPAHEAEPALAADARAVPRRRRGGARRRPGRRLGLRRASAGRRPGGRAGARMAGRSAGASITGRPGWVGCGSVRPGSSPSAEPVVIDPGHAFGTGAHGSTRAALELLQRLPRRRARSGLRFGRACNRRPAARTSGRSGPSTSIRWRCRGGRERRPKRRAVCTVAKADVLPDPLPRRRRCGSRTCSSTCSSGFWSAPICRRCCSPRGCSMADPTGRRSRERAVVDGWAAELVPEPAMTPASLPLLRGRAVQRHGGALRARSAPPGACSSHAGRRYLRGRRRRPRLDGAGDRRRPADRSRRSRR